MTRIAAHRMRGSPRLAVQSRDDLTHVELTWIEKKIEFWIRFGREAQQEILDRHRRIVSFRPNTVFAFVRWAANDFGTVISRIDICRGARFREPGRGFMNSLQETRTGFTNREPDHE